MSQDILVTGGGGFLGQAILKALRNQYPQAKLRSFARQYYPALDALDVQQILGDLRDPSCVEQAVQGTDLVFHTAAKVGVWGKPEDFVQINVHGTQHVLDACKKHDIPRLVYTSSPSVVFSGQDIEGADESLPYTTTQIPYPATKALAEQAVLAANGPSLHTIALRPHIIWGPGDPHICRRIIQRTKQRRLRRIGEADPLVDTVYIDNAADAHLCAAEALHQNQHTCGKAYFITNDQPIGIWTMVNHILHTAGLPPLRKTISPKAAYRIAAVLEAVYRIFRIQQEPPLTKFVVKELSTAHHFDITAAKNELGYKPKVSIQEGLQRLKRSLQKHP
ncbi:MAG: NAD-dependent epimerase/dehydratase family protein, partial [Myxococcota bacterium]